MKQTRRTKHSAPIPILVGIIALLVILVGIMGCSAKNQPAQKNEPAAVSSGYPAEYIIVATHSIKRRIATIMSFVRLVIYTFVYLIVTTGFPNELLSLPTSAFMFLFASITQAIE